MSIPRVYAAINAVASELAMDGIAKGHMNLEEQYAYRGIDDVYNRLGPVLARERLCVLPRVLERSCTARPGGLGDLLLHVTVKVAFDFVCAEDGSSHTVEAFGEALDNSDKGTAKAMQSAFKYALLQSFCVPLGAEDADSASPRMKAPVHKPEPVQGWEQWRADILDMIRGCQSKEALSRVQERHRSTLLALSRERADLYAQMGAAFTARRDELVRGAGNSSARGSGLVRGARKRKASPQQIAKVPVAANAAQQPDLGAPLPKEAEHA